MKLRSIPRRYTLRISQHIQEATTEPTWYMLLLRPDDTLVSTATKTCTRDVLADELVALAGALPGLTIIYDDIEEQASTHSLPLPLAWMCHEGHVW